MPVAASAAESALASHEPLIDSPAAIVDARGAGLRAVRQGHEQLGQLGVAVLRYQPRDVISPAAPAWLANDRQRLLADVREGEGYSLRPLQQDTCEPIAIHGLSVLL
jgi:hypothetical protein